MKHFNLKYDIIKPCLFMQMLKFNSPKQLLLFNLNIIVCYPIVTKISTFVVLQKKIKNKF